MESNSHIRTKEKILPKGWVKVESKSRPGRSYFYNAERKISLWRIEDLENFTDSNHNVRGMPTQHPVARGKTTPKKIPPGILQQSKSIKKNIAKDRMTKLKEKLAEESKQGKSAITELKSVSKVTNVTKSMTKSIPRETKKNIATKRMTKLNDQLKKEVAAESSSKIPKTIKEAAISNPILEELPQSEDIDMMEISFDDQLPSGCETMEWEDIPEQKVIDEIQKIRTIPEAAENSLSGLKIREVQGDFLVVVDTNVLLSNLDFVKDIKGKIFKDIGKATIYLPYIVLCELDNLKISQKQSLARLARRAIGFVEDCFKGKDSFIMGESALERINNRVIDIETGDDEILNCCLKMKAARPKLLLLTNDRNLRNKAFVNKIESYSRDMLNFLDFNAKNEIHFD